MSLPLNKVVNVTSSIENAGVLRRNFGIGLLITTDATLGSGTDRVQVFADFNTLSKFFDESREPYKAGNAWFSQSPRPKNFIVGRYFDKDTSGYAIGGKITTSVADIKALGSTAVFSLNIDGSSYNATVDVSAVTSYSEVATAIQTALTAKGAKANVIFLDTVQALQITSDATGSNSSVSSATGNLSDAMNFTTVSKTVNGNAKETIVDAIQAINKINNSYYFVHVDNLITSEDQITLADYCETQTLMFSLQTFDPNVLLSTDQSSVPYQIYQKQLQRTWCTYSAKPDYKCTSISARFSSVDFNAANSLITAKFKSLPTLTPDILSEEDVEALESKRVNYYTDFATDAIYSEGTCCDSSVYIDVRYALDWFVNAVQTNVYDLLRASGRLPQTNLGESYIINEINQACQQAVVNGMIAGGQVSDAMRADIAQSIGNPNFNGMLHTGYLIWSEPTTLQSEADRVARKATAKKVWLKSSGAIHEVDIGITLEN